MSQLVESLKAEHANIVKLLLRVSDLGIDTEEGRKTLLSAKTGLLAHLDREDEHLYPALLTASEEDPFIEDALEFFHDDIAVVSKLALEFFDKYSDDSLADQFDEDFATLAGLLLERIRKEESVLYKMYDQL